MTTRDRADACPGAVQTHLAADGRLARVRVPGGLLGGPQLLVLAQAAVDLADGALELTSRGNVQLRGLAEDAPAELARRLHGAGLLPSEAHETARNVVASVLSGRSGGLVDVRPVVRSFDAGLLADPALADLPGRFLVTVDDGRGDVHGLGGDAGLVAVAPDALALVLAGHGTDLRTDPAGAHDLLLRAARAFLAERAAQASQAWRLHELADGRPGWPPASGGRRRRCRSPRRASRRVARAGRRPGGAGRAGAAGPADHRRARRPGAGHRRAGQRGAADALAQRRRPRPARRVRRRRRHRAAPRGPGLRRGEPVGPGHRVRRAARLREVPRRRPGRRRAGGGHRHAAGRGPQHWAGCERRCGRPAGSVDVLATGQGYEIGAG